MIQGLNVQISTDTFFSNGATDVLYGSNLNDAIFYNNGTFADGVGGINGIQQFDLAAGDDIADFSAHGVGGTSYSKQILVRGGDGNDFVIGGSNSDDLRGDAGNDTLAGNAGGDDITGGDGDDLIYGDDFGANLVGGQDYLRGGNGNDTMYGGAKGDRLEGGIGDDVLYGQWGDDGLFGGAGNDVLYGDDVGGTGGDKLNGEDGDDKLFGYGGIDQLNGGNGADTLDGGDGNDLFDGGAGNDILIGGGGNDVLNGGADSDTVVFSGNRADYVVSMNPDGTLQLTDMRAGSPDGSDKIVNIEFLQFADTLVSINQLDNPPVITSNGGGATAAVSINENTADVTTVTATDPDVGQPITFRIGGGADASLFTIDPTTGALRFVAAPDYENAIDADGNGVYDVIVQAYDGVIATSQRIAVTVNDVADGAAPTITSNGGGATAVVDVLENTTAVTTVTASDADSATITYRIAGGADAALFTVDPATGKLAFVNAPDFETPRDAGGDNIYDVIVEASDGLNTDWQKVAVRVGNVNDNPTTLNAPNSVIVDENTTAVATLTATDADATVPGFGSTFSIVGGADSARFTVDPATGALRFINAPNFESPTDSNLDNIYEVIVQASDGISIDQKTVTVTVANVNEAPTVTSNGGGATATVTMAENGKAVTTVQGADPDGPATLGYVIAGGADAALFTIDAATGALSFISAPDFENPEDANRDNRYEVIVGTSDGTLVGTQALSIAITDVNEVGKVITGTSLNDTVSPTASSASLRSTALNDTIYGLDGNDIIDGGAGVDRMEGGNGNDTYTVDTFSNDGRSWNDDLVVEVAGGGIDRVNASVSYVLAAEVENLTLTGTASIDGTGNGLDNQLQGNSGNNVLAGAGGNDQVLGNDGSDTLFGDDGNDTLVGGNGLDTLNGGAGADRLDGGTGADSMTGGDGDDLYIVDSVDDVAVEAAGGGNDTVSSTVTYTLGAEIETLTLAGTLAINGTGNASANTINGNNAANILSGLDGNDTINAAGGDDVVYGGIGTDSIDGGAGNDILWGGEFSDTVKGGAGLDTISGGTGKDTLTGNTEADTFVFAFGDTTLNTNLDRITDFVGSTGDRIDLDFVAGSLASTAYAEASVASATFDDALALARTMMNTTTKVVFIAGTTDGWLFWDGAGNDGLPDQAVQMTGVTSTSLFDNTFIL
ncbi:beta strand repeat-containing protein [Prosthecomicrobium sp. N25]|uniref:beta strand repeat-containing protein n=1 Tax=Prosthecomicrobium sp. N25 TaxID=3129254 RepID=UPI003076C5C1